MVAEKTKPVTLVICSHRQYHAVHGCFVESVIIKNNQLPKIIDLSGAALDEGESVRDIIE